MLHARSLVPLVKTRDFGMTPAKDCSKEDCSKAVKKTIHFLRPSSTARLGPLEQRLLEALWSRGSATVRELMDDGDAARDHKIAYTTVMTTLDRLYKKKLLSRV